MDIIAMALFSIIMSITPGPVNLITLNSGLNHGFRQTMPYVSGATISFTLLLIVLGLGLSSFIMTYPELLHYISYVGTAYMIYTGYKIMMSSSMIDNQPQQNKVPKFIDGVLLQWSNPKAWMACLSGISTFSSSTSILPLISFVSIYFLICYVCIGIWAFAGMQLQFLLTSHRHMQLLSRSMGLLLIITSIYMTV